MFQVEIKELSPGDKFTQSHGDFEYILIDRTNLDLRSVDGESTMDYPHIALNTTTNKLVGFNNLCNAYVKEKPSPKVTIGGKPVKFNEDGSISVGCTDVSKEQLDTIIKHLNKNG